MSKLVGLMRDAALAETGGMMPPKIGYVTSYDPHHYTVKVRLEPDSTANEGVGLKPIVTNWLPLFRVFGGNGWGEVTPPNANPAPPFGDMALVVWPDGGHGVAFVGFYNDVERSYPTNSSVAGTATPVAGERWIVHPSGSFIKLLANGSVAVQDSQGGFLTVSGSPTGPPGPTSGSANSVVTRGDLNKVITDLIANIKLACQAISTTGAVVTMPNIEGSGSVTVSD